jgi:hypothetical protein
MNRAEEKRLQALEAAAAHSTRDAGLKVAHVCSHGPRCPGHPGGASVPLRIVDRSVLTPPPAISPELLAALRRDARERQSGGPGLSIEALLAIK